MRGTVCLAVLLGFALVAGDDDTTSDDDDFGAACAAAVPCA